MTARSTSHGSDHRSCSSISGNEVRELELKEIASRRSNADGSDTPADDEVAKTLVGAAFSGGGIRSGAFHLGVLQALYDLNLLRFIDYLSTVSGGGYAGAYLSSRALNIGQANASHPPRGQTDGDPFGNTLHDDKLPIKSGHNGQQPPRMLSFIFSGNYLKRFAEFFNRYLIGVVINFVMLFSGLVLFASLVSWAFHLLDRPRVVHVLMAFGFESDIQVAMFPSVLFFVCWGLAWIASFIWDRSRATGRVASVFFWLFLLSGMTAIAVLLGTGDLSTVTFKRQFEGMGMSEETFKSLSTAGYAFAYATIGASLLPYIRPQLLVRSGIAPRNAQDRVLFWLATRALVYGVPFLFIVYFAQEDISGHNKSRNGRFERRQELSEWQGHFAEAPFWMEVRRQATNSKGDPEAAVGAWIWKQLESKGKDLLQDTAKLFVDSKNELSQQELDVLKETADEVADAIRREPQVPNPTSANGSKSHLVKAEFDCISAITKERNKRFENLGLLSSIRTLATYLVEQEKSKSDLTVFVDASLSLEARKRRLVELLNRAVIDDPSFYKAFEKPIAEHKKSDKSVQAKSKWELLEKLHDDAQGLSDRLAEQSPTPEHFAPITRVNRRLLETYYGDLVKRREVIHGAVVSPFDQKFRLGHAAWAACFFGLSVLVVSLNFTSCHGYYSRKLGAMWLDPRTGGGHEIPLAQMESTDQGWPYHLINASLVLPGCRDRERGYMPIDQFLLSKRFCGSDRTQYAPTEKFMGGNYLLSDAIALSGGAVTPMQATNPLVRMLMWMFNLRLGQWVENPGHKPTLPHWMHELARRFLPVTSLRVMLSLAQQAEERPLSFVGDGGLFENLGIDPLLRRRCRLIIASDATEDHDYAFDDFMKLVRWARMKHGIKLEWLDAGEPNRAGQTMLDPIRPPRPTGNDQRSRFSESCFIVAKITYPPNDRVEVGYLIYLKATLLKDLPVELLQYAERNEMFPHDPTSDQFYAAAKFESYRYLGHSLMTRICASVPEDFSERTDDSYPIRVLHLINHLMRRNVESTKDCVFNSADEVVAELLRRIEKPTSTDDAQQATERLTSLVNSVGDYLAALVRSHITNRECQPAKEILHDLDKDGLQLLGELAKGSGDPAVKKAAVEILKGGSSGKRAKKV